MLGVDDALRDPIRQSMADTSKPLCVQKKPSFRLRRSDIRTRKRRKRKSELDQRASLRMIQQDDERMGHAKCLEFAVAPEQEAFGTIEPNYDPREAQGAVETEVMLPNTGIIVSPNITDHTISVDSSLMVSKQRKDTIDEPIETAMPIDLDSPL